jgi:mono/diheme cytochrome c family protein
MNTNRMKLIAIVFFALPLLMLSIVTASPERVAARTADDAAVSYKAKCGACHTPTASKFFDPAKADDELVQTTLKGRKGEKPPYMPSFEAKGMTADEALSLVTYMKGLKKAGN